ncbi:MAG: hypothetical protein AAFY17_04460 [Cyanobacteria bacterium J06642_11]
MSFDQPFKPARLLWLTFDFASGLPNGDDSITPELFLTLMAHPAVSQIKRFTAQAEHMGPDDIAQWEPGIFTLQVYRSNILEVLTQVAADLKPNLNLIESTASGSATMTIYTQLGRKHYPVVSGLETSDLVVAASDIETMVHQYEQNQVIAT